MVGHSNGSTKKGQGFESKPLHPIVPDVCSKATVCSRSGLDPGPAAVVRCVWPGDQAKGQPSGSALPAPADVVRGGNTAGPAAKRCASTRGALKFEMRCHGDFSAESSNVDDLRVSVVFMSSAAAVR